MFNHFGGDAFFDGLYRFTDHFKAVVHWPDIAPNSAVTDVAVLEHVPEDFLKACGPPVVVSDGRGIRDAVART